jgi:hypothetical protein
MPSAAEMNTRDALHRSAGKFVPENERGSVKTYIAIRMAWQMQEAKQHRAPTIPSIPIPTITRLCPRSLHCASCSGILCSPTALHRCQGRVTVSVIAVQTYITYCLALWYPFPKHLSSGYFLPAVANLDHHRMAKAGVCALV